MYDFSTITEVRLARGSHDRPETGMCFMEMAAWFAGEAHSDKPECACPVLGAYGINLNDSMPDNLRDCLLKPLVPMIAGTRDDASQQKRAEFLALWAVNKILPVALRETGLYDHAAACERAGDLSAARDAADAACAADSAYAAADAAARAAYVAARAAYVAGAAGAAAIWPLAVEGLRQAILIGRHEGFTDEASIPERHEALRKLVAA